MPSQKKSAIAQPKKKRTVNAKHKIEFEAPTLVDAESLAPEEGEQEIEDGMLDFEDEEIEQPRRPPSVKQRLRSKFEQKGIGGTDQITVRFDRLPSFEQNGMAGVKADKTFCGVITTTEKFFDNDEYLIRIQQSYGPGDYWITVRYKNSIISQWRESVGGFTATMAAQADGQPGPQTIIYQNTPGQPAQQVRQADPLAELRRAFQIVKEFKADLGIGGPQVTAAPAPPTDPDVVLLQSLASNDGFMNKIQNGAIRKILGDKAADDDPSYASVAMEMVKTGQADTAIRAFGDILLRIVDRIVPQWGVMNGQAPIAATQVQDQSQPDGGQVVPLSSVQVGSPTQPGALPQGDGRSAGRQVDARHPAPNASPSQTTPAQGAPGQPPTLMQIIQRLPIGHALQIVIQGQAPAQDIALAKVIDGCARKASPEGIIDWVFQFADEINAQLPDHSIDGAIELFTTATVDQIIAFVGALPGGDQVVALPHAREWTTELQRVIAESQPEEGDEA